MQARISETLFVASVLVLVSCKNHDGLTLSDHVTLNCMGLASDLARGADEYEKVAAALDDKQTPPDKRERIGQMLMMDSIGLSLDARSVKMLDIHQRFLFCIEVSKIDGRRESEIEAREGKLNDDLMQQDFDLPGVHQAMTHVDAVKELRELAGLAREVSRLPRKE